MVNYINTRDFEAIVEGSEQYEDGELDKWVTGGDVAPEGLLFLDGEKSPNGEPLLLAACEVSGTVAVYQLGDKALTVLPFADVEEDRWYVEAVQYAYENSLMEGTSGTPAFAPETNLSRAMAVQILFNLEGQPEVSDENLRTPTRMWTGRPGTRRLCTGPGSTRWRKATGTGRSAPATRSAGRVRPDAVQLRQVQGLRLER